MMSPRMTDRTTVASSGGPKRHENRPPLKDPRDRRLHQDLRRSARHSSILIRIEVLASVPS
jgi:hypothetical protein